MTAPTMPQTWRTTCACVDQTIALGATLAPLLQPNDVILLVGDLGAGKTHFTKGVASGLGCTGKVTSPTFNIMLEYDGGRLPLYHFDLYRLDDVWQLDDVDYFGLLEDGCVSVVEWGDKFPEALPQSYLELRLTVAYPDAPQGEEPPRTLYLRGYGERGRELARAWAAARPQDWKEEPEKEPHATV